MAEEDRLGGWLGFCSWARRAVVVLLIALRHGRCTQGGYESDLAVTR